MSDHDSVLMLTTETFDEQVLQSDRPVLVDFWATWCPPCKALAPVLEQLAGAYRGRAKVGKLDVDAHPELAARYGIQAVPTMLFFQNGEVADHAVGALPAAELAQKLDRLLAAEPA